jgi:hypothetical protein
VILATPAVLEESINVHLICIFPFLFNDRTSTFIQCFHEASLALDWLVFSPFKIKSFILTIIMREFMIVVVNS